MLHKFTFLISLFVVLLLSTTTSIAQTVPDGVIFQAVATDPQGNPAAGRTIYIKATILQSTATGTEVYSEAFKITASSAGVFTVVIGKGQNISGPASIASLDWTAGPYFLNIKSAVEPSIPLANWDVNQQYVDMGTSQFWSVPFALYATKVAGFDLKMNIADTTNMLKAYLRKTDTASISNRINLKLNTIDTSSMLTNYLRKGNVANTDSSVYTSRARTQKGMDSIGLIKINVSDTANMLSHYANVNSIPSITGKVNSSDTASMLTNYLRKGNVANTDSSIYASRARVQKSVDSIGLVKINANDTANMLSHYANVNSIPSITGKLNYTDTAAMLSAYLADRFTKVKYTDTTAMLSHYANVNSIPVITGKVNYTDTAAMFSAYLANRFTKVNYTDTASMLSHYANVNSIPSVTTKVNYTDTAAMLSAYLANRFTKVNYTDTSSMLSHYANVNSIPSVTAKVNYTDTAAMLSAYLANRFTKVNYTDTASMLSHYANVNSIPSVTAKVNYTDTAAMLSAYLANRFTKVNNSDTASMLSPYQRAAFATSKFVPYTGATGAVNLGAYDLTVNTLTVGFGHGSISSNTAIGTSALINNTTGSVNTAIGNNALNSNTTGSFNTGEGFHALASNTIGTENTAVGFSSLLVNTNSYNTGLGVNSLVHNTTGQANTALGNATMFGNITGSNNTVIGSGSDVGSDGLTNATAIGYNASVTTSNTIQLGNTSVSNVKTSGTITAGAITYPNAHGTSGQVLSTTGSGTLAWTTPSTPGNASASATGLLSSTDWNTFNNKQSALTFSTGLTNTSGTVSVNASQNIATLSNLTSNGLIKTSGGTGTLNIASAGTDYLAPFASQTANYVYAAPDGATGVPSFRALVANDIPSLSSTFLPLSAGNSKPLTGVLYMPETASNDINQGISWSQGAPTSYGIYRTSGTWTSPNFAQLEMAFATGIVIDGGSSYAKSGTSIQPNGGATSFGGTVNLMAGSTTIAPLQFNSSGLLGTKVAGSVEYDGTNLYFTDNTAARQTLLTATNGVPYTGATAAVNLGAYDLLVNTLTVGLGHSSISTNTVVGNSALLNNSTGSLNTAIGPSAMNANTTGFNNIAIGYHSLMLNTTGHDNTGNGVYSLAQNLTGNLNTAIGGGALYSNTTGSNNTASGQASLNNNTTGSNNSASGFSSLLNNTTGQSNTTTGSNSLLSNTTGGSNTANGYQSLSLNTAGSQNTGAGLNSLYRNQGNNNTAIGSSALQEITAGNNNTSLGYWAGLNVANGTLAYGQMDNSVLLGANTKTQVIGGTNEIVIGYNAIGNGSNTIQLGNTSITNVKTSGTLTLGAITLPNTDGTSGQFLKTNGSGSVGWANSTITGIVLDPPNSKVNILADGVSQGNESIAIGYSAGNYQGSQSVAIGSWAGSDHQGNQATAIGNLAGRDYQGNQSVAIGYYAGNTNQGANSTALGRAAGQSNQGSNSIAIGNGAGQTNQAANSIILNAAGGVALNNSNSGFFVSPISSSTDATQHVLIYNTSTNEISSNSAKTFVINHPTKPDSYLVHACLEGPEAGVYYRGEAKIENNKSVSVSLPEYVSSFAGNFSIQITPIYTDDTDENIVYSTSRVKDNAFTVHGKNGSFYWLVYAQRGKIEVEPKKSAVQVGGDGPYKYIKSQK